MNEKKQLKGLSALVTDAVVNGASAVERVHLAVSSRPFDILEEIPIVSTPSSVVRVVHDLSTRATYASIRGITRLVGRAVELAIDVHGGPGGERTAAEGEVSPTP